MFCLSQGIKGQQTKVWQTRPSLHLKQVKRWKRKTESKNSQKKRITKEAINFVHVHFLVLRFISLFMGINKLPIPSIIIIELFKRFFFYIRLRLFAWDFVLSSKFELIIFSLEFFFCICRWSYVYFCLPTNVKFLANLSRVAMHTR